MSAGTDMSAKDADTTLDNAAHGGCPATTCYASSCGRVTLYLGDCMDIMPTLGAVDALVSDPPYGIAWQHGGNRGNWGGKGTSKITGKKQPAAQTAAIMGDAEPFDPRPLLGIAPKCLLWGAIHFSDKLPTSRHWIVWDKHLANNGTDFAEVDFAWTNHKGNAVSHRQLWNGCLVEGEERTNRNGSTRCHPTQKPIRLMIFCMDRLRIAEGETVLDPYMGSGTTGIACLRTGRRFIGIEKDHAHYATALERITNELRQGDLFLGHNVIGHPRRDGSPNSTRRLIAVGWTVLLALVCADGPMQDE